MVKDQRRTEAPLLPRAVRWGVLSTAKIGRATVIPAMQQAASCEVVAISSRRLDAAQAAADRLGLATAYGSYDALLADDEINAVYNPLPNRLHVPWSIKALEAGKHVLCEKPIGLSAADGRRLVAAAKQHPRLKVMEAFMYRHHPQWQRARSIVRTGGIGRLRTIQVVFSYFNDDAGDIRNQADIGGGALMDIGCYPVSLSRFMFDAEPIRVCGVIDRDPRFGTDRHTSAILEFAEGTSSFVCSTQAAPCQRVSLLGDAGQVEIEIPFNPPPDRRCRLWWQHSDGRREEIALEICDQYTIQGELFSEAILQDTPVPTPLDDAVANMTVIDAVFRSAESGHWEPVTLRHRD